MPQREERLARLEEQLYFQERTIQDLNQALTQQQFQMDSLEQRLAFAETRLAMLLPLLSDGGENTPPPHYGGT